MSFCFRIVHCTRLDLNRHSTSPPVHIGRRHRVTASRNLPSRVDAVRPRSADAAPLPTTGNRPGTQIEQHPERDLAIFRLPASAALRGRPSPRHVGLSPIGFRNRPPLSTLALVAHDDVAIRRRYEGWGTRVSQPPRLGAICRCPCVCSRRPSAAHAVGNTMVSRTSCRVLAASANKRASCRRRRASASEASARDRTAGMHASWRRRMIRTTTRRRTYRFLRILPGIPGDRMQARTAHVARQRYRS